MRTPMRGSRSRFRVLAVYMLMTGAVLVARDARAAVTYMATNYVYDEQVVETNAVDTEAAGNNISLADFKAALSNRYDAGLSGVVTMDDAPGSAVAQVNVRFGADGGQCLGLTADPSHSPNTTVGRISGTHAWYHGGSAGSFLFSFCDVRMFGITVIPRSGTALAEWNMTATFTDGSTMDWIVDEPVVNTEPDDTFFALEAPAGKFIRRIDYSHSDGNTRLDDLGFVLGQEAEVVYREVFSDAVGGGNTSGNPLEGWWVHVGTGATAVAASKSLAIDAEGWPMLPAVASNPSAGYTNGYLYMYYQTSVKAAVSVICLAS